MSEEKVMNPAAEAEEEEERLHEQVKVRRDKLAALCEAGKNPYEITKYDWDTKNQEIRDNFEALEGKTVRIAGRMMSRRVMGKASFMDLLDSTGRLQVYVRRDDVGEEDYADFKKWDIGDILGVEGTVFRTQKGEISVHTTHIKLLSKSLLPLPEKFHGLTGYRYPVPSALCGSHREPGGAGYLRISAAAILTEIRRYLDEKGFLEVDTPILVPLEIGASARPVCDPPQYAGYGYDTCALRLSFTSSGSSWAAWIVCTRWDASSAMRVWIPSTTPNSPPWSCTRPTPITRA